MNNYFCIDVGGTFIKYGLIKENGEIVSEGKVPTPHTDHRGFTSFIAEMVPEDVKGIAICFPGFIDGKNGICLSCGTLEWMEDNYHIAEEVGRATGKPVTVENDAHCACLAELWKGSLKGAETGCIAVLGTRIGMGIVLNGKLYTGSQGKAGEPGYNLSRRKGLWGYSCSVPLLCEDRAKMLGRDALSGQELMELYTENDEKIVPLVEDYLSSVTEGLFAIQNLFDFEKIAIGGGISANMIFIRVLKEKFHSIYASLPYQLHEPEIEACSMKNDANLLGALYYHLNRY